MTIHTNAATSLKPASHRPDHRMEAETDSGTTTPRPTVRRRSARRAAVTAASLAALSTAAASSAAAQPVAPLQITQCPALYVLGVDGTGQSSPAASPSTGTGVLGPMVEPLLAAGPAVVQRAYVPYDASFGGAPGTGGTAAPYTTSVTAATGTLTAMAAQVAATCPATKIAGVGYSQGAHAVSQFAAAVGAGTGSVRPEQIAGVALFSDPARPGGTTVLPGRPGQTPAPAPGTAGAAVSTIVLPNTAAGGAGIDDEASRFGALTGRVAEFCATGDLSCAVPAQAPLLRAGAALAAQASITDPAAAVATATTALGAVATGVLADDVTVTGGIVNYTPSQSISQRAATAADPRTAAPNAEQQGAATQRWNQVTAAVAADPVGQLPRVMAQAGAALGQIVTENRALLDPATWAGAHASHTGYGDALAAGSQWFAALAADLAGPRPR